MIYLLEASDFMLKSWFGSITIQYDKPAKDLHVENTKSTKQLVIISNCYLIYTSGISIILVINCMLSRASANLIFSVISYIYTSIKKTTLFHYLWNDNKSFFVYLLHKFNYLLLLNYIQLHHYEQSVKTANFCNFDKDFIFNQ